MKQENQQILGILAIIFGAIALLGSWIPIINYLSLIIAVPTLILGIIGIVLSPKKQKTLAILGTSFALIAIIVSVITQFLFSNILNGWVTKYSHTYRQEIPYFEGEQGGNLPDTSIDEYQDEDDIEEDQGFTWTQDQFDALVEGDLSNRGQGGSNYQDVIKKHGIPDNVTDSNDGDYQTKRISYIFLGSESKAVILTFVKQENGQFLLIHKFSIGLDQEQQKNSDMTI
ncbi:hypothetical protein [Streptococcus mitis]|uniref:hypothetical protein n=1 Tax=Streptococcus mitis TaxID=28037 RepID=UPI00115B84E5|nr:hypothetical protein [Streptococcus mitis]